MSIAFPVLLRRACLPAALSLALSACSGQLTPPEDIDGATTVSSIERRQKSDDSNYSAPDDPASVETYGSGREVSQNATFPLCERETARTVR